MVRFMVQFQAFRFLCKCFSGKYFFQTNCISGFTFSWFRPAPNVWSFTRKSGLNQFIYFRVYLSDWKFFKTSTRIFWIMVSWSIRWTRILGEWNVNVHDCNCYASYVRWPLTKHKDSRWTCEGHILFASRKPASACCICVV